MWKKSCVLLTMVFGLAAQTDTAFTVGKIGVQLGEDQQTVLSTLRTAYEVHSVGEKTWVAGTSRGRISIRLAWSASKMESLSLPEQPGMKASMPALFSSRNN